VYKAPSRLWVNGYQVPLFPGQKLYACHTTSSGDNYAEKAGQVITKKNDSSQLGLKNLSGDTWTYLSDTGKPVSAGNGAVIPLNRISKIEFKKINGKISRPGETAQSEDGLYLLVKNYRLPLTGGQKLYACHVLSASDDAQTMMGEVVTNKKDPSLLGIRNLSDDEWFFTNPANNEKKGLKKNEVFPLSGSGSFPIDARHELLVNFRDMGGKIAVMGR
jgi:hypothetical protein